MNVLEFTLLGGLGAVAAGFLGALTGLGGGVVTVPLLALAFGVDIRYAIGASLVSVIATSSGAAASAGIYLARGNLDPGLTMPVMLGVLLGSVVGARLLPGAPPRVLRAVFALVIVALGIEMIYQGVTGKL